MRNTKIAVTLGPQCWLPTIVFAMIQAGADIFRFNYSHPQTPEDYNRLLRLMLSIPQMAVEAERKVETFVDCPGRKFRIVLDVPEFGLQHGQETWIVSSPLNGYPVCPHPRYLELAQEGKKLYIADGSPVLEVLENRKGNLRCRVIEGKSIEPGKGITLEGVHIANLGLHPVTEKDLIAIQAAIDGNADFLGMSYGATAAECDTFQATCEQRGATKPKKVFKLELVEAVKDADALAQRNAAIYFGKGDFGLSTAPEEVPHHSQVVAAACHKYGTEYWPGTETCLSMKYGNTRPTHGEIAGIYRLLDEGADCIVLSDETAKSPYAVQTVQALDRILCAAERG